MSLVTNTFSSGIRVSFFSISQTKWQLHNNFRHLGYRFFGIVKKNISKQNNVVHTRLPRMMHRMFLHIFKRIIVHPQLDYSTGIGSTKGEQRYPLYSEFF